MEYEIMHERPFLPAFDVEKILEIAKREAAFIQDHHTREDAAQEFALGALLAMRRDDGIRSLRGLQWKYGRGFLRHYLFRNRRFSERIKVVLDAPYGDDEGEGKVSDTIGDAKAESIPDVSARADDAGWVRDLIASLPKRLGRLVHLRFFEGLSLERAGARLGVSRERARQLERIALDRLRVTIRSRKADRLLATLPAEVISEFSA